MSVLYIHFDFGVFSISTQFQGIKLSSFPSDLPLFCYRSYSSTSIEETMKRGEDPPTPPPRPQKTHSRASSLDLNKVFQPSVPGEVPPSHLSPSLSCWSQYMCLLQRPLCVREKSRQTWQFSLLCKSLCCCDILGQENSQTDT